MVFSITAEEKVTQIKSESMVSSFDTNFRPFFYHICASEFPARYNFCTKDWLCAEKESSNNIISKIKCSIAIPWRPFAIQKTHWAFCWWVYVTLGIFSYWANLIFLSALVNVENVGSGTEKLFLNMLKILNTLKKRSKICLRNVSFIFLLLL